MDGINLHILKIAYLINSHPALPVNPQAAHGFYGFLSCCDAAPE